MKSLMEHPYDFNLQTVTWGFVFRPSFWSTCIVGDEVWGRRDDGIAAVWPHVTLATQTQITVNTSSGLTGMSRKSQHKFYRILVMRSIVRFFNTFLVIWFLCFLYSSMTQLLIWANKQIAGSHNLKTSIGHYSINMVCRYGFLESFSVILYLLS